MIVSKISPSMDELAPYITDAISSGKKVKLTVTGNSMYPLFKDRRDTVILAPFESVNKKDVVFYRRQNGRYVLHRVLKKKGDSLVLAGDNETQKEYGISVSDCIAVMKSFERYGKKSDVSDLWYRLYSSFWTFVFPVRPCCRWILRLGACVFRKR
ncbi:MAG: S24/S26 family peptidase [Clostridia bacterium]|nr:S24/S26 family peptidase [Clostridia bacterium]